MLLFLIHTQDTKYNAANLFSMTGKKCSLSLPLLSVSVSLLKTYYANFQDACLPQGEESATAAAAREEEGYFVKSVENSVFLYMT